MALLCQLIFSGIVIGIFYALVGYGLSIIIKATNNWHFAHGAVFAVGAYTFSSTFMKFGLPIWAVVIFTIAVVATIGAAMEYLIYKPLRARGADVMVTLVASISLLGVVNNIIGLGFGLTPINIYVEGLNDALINTDYLTVGKWDVMVVILGLGIAGLLILLMKKTELGVLIRAVSDNPRYAQMMGVNLVWMYLLSFILGSAVVGIPSMLIALHNQLNPDIGLQIYLFAVIAVVIGGTGSLSGTLLGGLSVGILQKVSVWKLPEEWSSFITFAVLFGIIILRPKGIFGLN